MTVDVSAFIGLYPFRALPDWSADFLLRSMDRVDIEQAWVGHLPSAFFNDPAPGSRELIRTLAPHASRLRPVPTIDPNLPGWEDEVHGAREIGAPAIRTYPMHQGRERLADLIAAAAEVRTPVLLTVRFEDGRQRHPIDTVPDLTAALVRQAVRAHSRCRIIVTHAGRDLVEEVHYTLTDQEAARLRWDVSWIWGPPFDDLRHLVTTIGVDAFVFGTGMPLRLPENTVAKLEVSDLDAQQVRAVQSGNLARWLAET
jgi:predicted TIM-barrel fold metal-dependent hydrolase